ncbi:cation:proton antiporter [Haloferula sp.]|uniref:cation:proton antiporter domain-containing protein n=1 Tax=Haloferula sp. TaxID=2497595 RepID=UPI00329F23F4
MVAILITVAFLAGMAVRKGGLPPMVGFIIAGFGLRVFGFEASDDLNRIANFGVTLLLFTIGLKLKVSSLTRGEVWAGTSIHMAVTSLTMAAVALAFGALGLPLFSELDIRTALLLGFALSFSSTVFAAKAFEERAELATRHATVAIGILIMQDVIAVIFLTVSSGKVPSVWALGLFALPFLRRYFNLILEKVAHGELLLLFGFVMTFAGYGLFDMVGLKGDLGAIAFGILMASSPKAESLAKMLFGFKDLFLVAFFLSIGLSEDLSWSAVVAAFCLLPFVIPKSLGYIAMLCGFKMRVRPAFLAGLGLANFSEFGLIVGSVMVASGWLSGGWLVAIAVLVALSFVVAAPLNVFPYVLFDRFGSRLKRLERRARLAEDGPIPSLSPEVVVFGMGRVGTGVYDWLAKEKGLVVVGVDSCPEKVASHKRNGRKVVLGDATDPEFWERIEEKTPPKMVFIATHEFRATRRIADRLLAAHPEAKVTALVRHVDRTKELEEIGVKGVFDLYREAGTAFAEGGWEKVGKGS